MDIKLMVGLGPIWWVIVSAIVVAVAILVVIFRKARKQDALSEEKARHKLRVDEINAFFIDEDARVQEAFEKCIKALNPRHQHFYGIEGRAKKLADGVRWQLTTSRYPINAMHLYANIDAIALENFTYAELASYCFAVNWFEANVENWTKKEVHISAAMYAGCTLRSDNPSHDFLDDYLLFLAQVSHLSKKKIQDRAGLYLKARIEHGWSHYQAVAAVLRGE